MQTKFFTHHQHEWSINQNDAEIYFAHRYPGDTFDEIARLSPDDADRLADELHDAATAARVFL